MSNNENKLWPETTQILKTLSTELKYGCQQKSSIQENTVVNETNLWTELRHVLNRLLTELEGVSQQDFLEVWQQQVQKVIEDEQLKKEQAEYRRLKKKFEPYVTYTYDEVFQLVTAAHVAADRISELQEGQPGPALKRLREVLTLFSNDAQVTKDKKAKSIE